MPKKQLKVCINNDCSEHHEKYMYAKNFIYCPHCGQRMYHVCKHKGCFEKLIDPQATLCEKHMIERDAKSSQKFVDANSAIKTGMAGISLLSAAGAVFSPIIKMFSKRK